MIADAIFTNCVRGKDSKGDAVYAKSAIDSISALHLRCSVVGHVHAVTTPPAAPHKLCFPTTRAIWQCRPRRTAHPSGSGGVVFTLIVRLVVVTSIR